MKKLISTLLIVAPLSCAQAQMVSEPGWHARIGLGQTSVQDPVKGQELTDIVTSAFTSVGGIDLSTYNPVATQDDSDSGLKITSGYQFNSNFGVEVFYADLGEASASSVANDVSVVAFPVIGLMDVRAEVSYETQVLGVAATGGFNLGDRVRLFGKAGAFQYDTSTEFLITVQFTDPAGTPTTQSVDENNDGSSIVAGFGMGVAFTPNWQLVAEWERYADVDIGSHETDIDLISASLQYRF